MTRGEGAKLWDVRGFNLGDPGDELLRAAPFAQQSGEVLNESGRGGQGRATFTDGLKMIAVFGLQAVRPAQGPLAHLPDGELGLPRRTCRAGAEGC